MLQSVLAQVNTDVRNPYGDRFNVLRNVFGVALNVVMFVAVGLALVFLALGGLKYMTSKGDAKAAEEARTWLTNAIIGLVIALGALAIRAILFGILNVNITDTGNIIPVQ